MPNPFFNSAGAIDQSHRPDNLKITKSSLKFGPVTVMRGNAVPSMDFGRPGDLILIDSTDIPSTTLQSKLSPDSVGLWMKIPLSASIAPTGHTVVGKPFGHATAGDVLRINGITVGLSSPYTTEQVATDITAANIPNIAAQNIHDTLMITNSTGEAITVVDAIGTASVTLGIYSEISVTEMSYLGKPATGVWMPVGYVATSGVSSSPAAAAYVTMFADAGLPNARVFGAGVGVKVTDGGNTVTVEHDIDGVTATSEPLDGGNDTILFYNQSTSSVEKATIDGLVSGAGVVTESVGLQQRNILLGTANTYNIGPLLPAGSYVRSVSLTIVTPYTSGTLIEIGDAGISDRLMTSGANDAQNVGTYDSVSNLQYAASVQIVATISGAPTAGAAMVIVDYIIP